MAAQAPATMEALLSSLTQSLATALDATPKIAALEPPKDGLSLLDVKNELLLSYLQNLVFLILMKLRNAKDDTSDKDDGRLADSVRAKLVQLRLYLEKGARPLEEKLRFSIDRFLRTAEDAQREGDAAAKKINGRSGSVSDSDDNSDSDANEAPRPAFSRGGKGAAPKVEAIKQDITGRSADRDDGRDSNVYRPPRRDRVVMDSTKRHEKPDRRPAKSRTMEEYINSELSTAPVAEPSIGTTIVEGGRRTKTVTERQDEAERRDYEEANFTRLAQQSKKERAQKAKQADKSSRMMFGGEEWHDLGDGVDRINRLTKQKTSGGNVKALLEKSRKRGPDTTDGPRGTGRAPEIGERFQKRAKTMSRKERR